MQWLKGFKPLKAAINQLLANQGGNQGSNMENAQGGQPPTNPPNSQVVPIIPARNPPIAAEVPPVVV